MNKMTFAEFKQRYPYTVGKAVYAQALEKYSLTEEKLNARLEGYLAKQYQQYLAR